MSEKQNTGYFDAMVEGFEENCLQNCGLEDVFYVKDLLQRKIFIHCPIEQETVDAAVHHILQFNRDDRGIPPEERRPILLYVNSKGGEEEPGYMLIDAILESVTPVYTVNLGYQYSMAFLIGLAGHKRFATRHARFLMHDGVGSLMDSTSKIYDFVEFQKKAELQLKEYVLNRSKISSSEYDAKHRVEWYMLSDEAKKFGFTDYIIGEDCDLDEII